MSAPCLQSYLFSVSYSLGRLRKVNMITTKNLLYLRPYDTGATAESKDAIYGRKIFILPEKLLAIRIQE